MARGRMDHGPRAGCRLAHVPETRCVRDALSCACAGHSILEMEVARCAWQSARFALRSPESARGRAMRSVGDERAWIGPRACDLARASLCAPPRSRLHGCYATAPGPPARVVGGRVCSAAEPGVLRSRGWCVVTTTKPGTSRTGPLSRCASPAGESPVPVSAGAPGSRPQARGRDPGGPKRGVESLQRREPRREQERGPQHEVKPAASTDKQSGEPSRSCHGEGNIRRARVRNARDGSRRGRGRSTRARRSAEHGRPVCAAVVTARRLV